MGGDSSVEMRKMTIGEVVSFLVEPRSLSEREHGYVDRKPRV